MIPEGEEFTHGDYMFGLVHFMISSTSEDRRVRIEAEKRRLRAKGMNEFEEVSAYSKGQKEVF